MENDSWIGIKHRLETQIGETPFSGEAPTHLPLEDILEVADVFQHRSGNQAASRKHTQELVRSLRASDGKPFTSLTVFWIGTGWCCIDGHHRLAAYKEGKFLGAIPVRVLRGSIDAAIAEALNGNSRDKLAMGRDEKIQAAWRLVTGTQLSKAAVMRASGASEGTVAHQRRVKRNLSESHPALNLGGLTWRDANKMYLGLEITPRDCDHDWVDVEAQKLADRLTKTFGDILGKNSEVTARALEKYSEPLVAALADHWRDYIEDDGLPKCGPREDNSDF